MNRVFENLLKARVRLSLIRGRGEEPDFPHEQIESHGHKARINIAEAKKILTTFFLFFSVIPIITIKTKLR